MILTAKALLKMMVQHGAAKMGPSFVVHAVVSGLQKEMKFSPRTNKLLTHSPTPLVITETLSQTNCISYG